MNILLTCAGRRHNLALHFRAAVSGRGRLIGADMSLSAPALAACDSRYQVPPASDPDYLEQIVEIIEREDVKMVFPLNDLEIGLFAEHREAVSRRTGALLYVPDPDTYRVCADKWQTFKFVKQLGAPSILTVNSVDAALAAVDSGEALFPLVVKPRWGSASIAVERVADAGELMRAYERCHTTVLRSSLAALGTRDAVIIQQMMTGPEFGIDVLFDSRCNYLGFTAKRKLEMRAGETDKAVTVARGPFEAQIRKLASHLTHRGNLDCDFLEQDGVYYLLEMNPRFGGGYPFTHEAGANHVQRLVNDYIGLQSPPYHYEEGKAFAKWDLLASVPP